jgi:hypothetical protein
MYPAVLKTLCGCSKIVDLPRGLEMIRIPLSDGSSRIFRRTSSYDKGNPVFLEDKDVKVSEEFNKKG